MHSKASSIRLVWESLSQLSRAAAAAFIVLATLRDRRYWVDAVPLVYAFVLGLARPLYNNKQWRLAALLQVNLALTFSFLTLVSGEVLPLLIANNHEVLPKAIKTALACTTAAVVVAVCTPREWQPDLRILEVMDTTPEPSPEETCSIAVHYWTYEWLTPLMWKGARGDLTMDDLPSLPSYDEPLLLLRRINDARAKGKTTLWTILRFLHRELIKMVFCTALAFSLDLVAPYGMYQLLGYLANPKGSPILPWAWLSLMFLGPVLKSISFQQYIFTSTRLIVRLTSALTQQLYYRAMTSMELEEDIFADKDEAGKDKKDGADADAAGAEGSADTKEAIGKATNAGRLANLMSSDIDSIWQGRDMIMVRTIAPFSPIISLPLPEGGPANLAPRKATSTHDAD